MQSLESQFKEIRLNPSSNATTKEFTFTVPATMMDVKEDKGAQQETVYPVLTLAKEMPVEMWAEAQMRFQRGKLEEGKDTAAVSDRVWQHQLTGPGGGKWTLMDMMKEYNSPLLSLSNAEREELEWRAGLAGRMERQRQSDARHREVYGKPKHGDTPPTEAEAIEKIRKMMSPPKPQDYNKR